MEVYINRTLFTDLHVTSGASTVNITDESKKIFINDCSVRNCTSDDSGCVFLVGNAVYTSRLCFHRDWAKEYWQSLLSVVPDDTNYENKVEEITVNQCPPNEEGKYDSMEVYNGKVSFRDNNLSYCKLKEQTCLYINRNESIPWEFVTLDSNEVGYQLCWFEFNGPERTQTFWKWNIVNNGRDGKLFYGPYGGPVFQMEECVIGNNRFKKVTNGGSEFICINSFICSNSFSKGTLEGRECTKTWKHQNYRPGECYEDLYSLYLKEKEEKEELLKKMIDLGDYASLKYHLLDSWNN